MCALRAVAATFSVLLALVVMATPGAAGGGFERIVSYDVHVTIEDDGSLLVRETIDYDFGAFDRHGIFREIPVRFGSDEEHHDRVYPLDVVSVRATEGTPAQYTVETDGNAKRVKIGDPDATITGEHGYEITYRVRGVLNGFDDHDELVWNAIGPDWSVVVERATVTVEAPATITQVACSTGPLGSTLSCQSAMATGRTATFSQGELFPFNGMTVTVAVPKGAVPEPAPILEERWYFARGFEPSLANAGGSALLVVGLLGGVAMIAYRGRDRRFAGSPVDAAFGSAEGREETAPLLERTETPVEFEPPDGLRPGQIGTLVDFTANPLDVTASIVDLAVRGYLTIEEVPDAPRRQPDWRLTKRKDHDVEPYEQRLMAGLFSLGDEVQLSDLRYKFASCMSGVRKALVDDAMTRKWFTKRPDRVRTAWAVSGILVALAGVALFVVAVAFTRLALLPVPVIAAGIMLFVAAWWMPRRTAAGYALLRRTDGFRRFIEESEAERARFAERANLFSEYLPYAVVFGATEKWARAFAGLDGAAPDVSSWYVGAQAFTIASFSQSIDGFTVSSAGTLGSSPPSTSGSSGFSGGGFSGGGAGGGGGGSW